MKSISARQTVLSGLLMLALAQFACSLGASAGAGASQPTSASGASTTQPSAKTSSAHGTVDQAMTMLKEAVQHYGAVGRTQALADFTNRVAPFYEGDLYVACIDSKLVQTANGGFPNLVGSSVEPLSRAQWDAASTSSVKSVSYSYTDPVTGKSTPKTLYYERVGSDVCGVGVYHQ